MAEPRSPGEARLHRLAEPEKDVAAGTRTLVIGPYLSRARAPRAETPDVPIVNPRPTEARLDEAVGLARAIDLTVVGATSAALNTLRPATYLGKGKVEEVAGWVSAEHAGLVVMDCA